MSRPLASLINRNSGTLNFSRQLRSTGTRIESRQQDAPPRFPRLLWRYPGNLVVAIRKNALFIPPPRHLHLVNGHAISNLSNTRLSTLRTRSPFYQPLSRSPNYHFQRNFFLPKRWRREGIRIEAFLPREEKKKGLKRENRMETN